MYSSLGLAAKRTRKEASPIVNHRKKQLRTKMTHCLASNEIDSEDEHLEGGPPFKKQLEHPTENETKGWRLCRQKPVVYVENSRSPIVDKTIGQMRYPLLSSNRQELSHFQLNRQHFMLELASKIYQDKMLQISCLNLRSPKNIGGGCRLPPSELFVRGTNKSPMAGIDVPRPVFHVERLVNISRMQSLLLNQTEDKITSARATINNLSFNHGTYLSLAADEDHNWLSELQCFVRSELVEIFKASHQDVEDRQASKNVNYLQAGIRCRFCSHLPFNERAQRSSCFPSTTLHMYQSFIMMVREHFGKCSAVPGPIKSHLFELKKTKTQGDSQCKEYWVYSAAKVGLVDSENGIMLNDKTRAAGLLMPSFGTCADSAPNKYPTILLVSLDDRGLVSEFIYNLTLQCEKIHLLPSELTGSRKMLKVGTPGFGCRHCSAKGRLGLSRVFPVKRNKLPGQVCGFWDHIRRCTNCPLKTKIYLARLQKEEKVPMNKGAAEKKFFDSVWTKLEKTTQEEA